MLKRLLHITLCFTYTLSHYSCENSLTAAKASSIDQELDSLAGNEAETVDYLDMDANVDASTGVNVEASKDIQVDETNITDLAANPLNRGPAHI